jgi:hypothetical protein
MQKNLQEAYDNKLKNKDLYKTPEERMEAFNKFCDSSDWCCNCMLHDFAVDGSDGMCILQWLELEPKSSGELIMQLVQNLKNLNLTESGYRYVSDIVSETRREQIKAIWAKQDEEKGGK